MKPVSMAAAHASLPKEEDTSLRLLLQHAKLVERLILSDLDIFSISCNCVVLFVALSTLACKT